MVDVHLHRIAFHGPVAPVGGGLQLGPGQHPASVFQQGFQQGEFPGGKLHLLTGQIGPPGRRVQFDGAVTQARASAPVAAPDQAAQPGRQLVQVEGFDHVIIGPPVQGPEIIRHRVPGGENQNGHILAPLAAAAEQVQARKAGQVPVQHQGIESLRLQAGPGRFPIPHPVHGKTGEAQAHLDAVPQEGIVFDQENAHGVFLC